MRAKSRRSASSCQFLVASDLYCRRCMNSARVNGVSTGPTWVFSSVSGYYYMIILLILCRSPSLFQKINAEAIASNFARLKSQNIRLSSTSIIQPKLRQPMLQRPLRIRCFLFGSFLYSCTQRTMRPCLGSSKLDYTFRNRATARPPNLVRRRSHSTVHRVRTCMTQLLESTDASLRIIHSSVLPWMPSHDYISGVLIYGK